MTADKADTPGAQLRALATLGTGFCLSFCGWSVLESNIVARHGRLGYQAMACVYYGIGPGALFTPLIIERLGPVASMCTSVTTYVAFAAANFLLECKMRAGTWLLLPAALGVGLTCPTLWTAQGIYLSNLSRWYDHLRQQDTTAHGSLGLFNGTVSAIMTGGTLSGLLFSSALMRMKVDMRILFGAMFGVLASGMGVLSLLPPHRPFVHSNANTTDAEQASSLLESLAAVPQMLLRSRPAQLMAMSFLARGMIRPFEGGGTFATDVVSASLGAEFVGYVIAFKEVCRALGGAAMGALSDRVGRATVLAIAEFGRLIFISFFCLNTIRSGSRQFSLIFALAALPSLLNGQSTQNALQHELFEHDGQKAVTVAMSVCQVADSLGSGTGYLLTGGTMRSKALSAMGVQIIGTIGIMAAALLARGQARVQGSKIEQMV